MSKAKKTKTAGFVLNNPNSKLNDPKNVIGPTAKNRPTKTKPRRADLPKMRERLTKVLDDRETFTVLQRIAEDALYRASEEDNPDYRAFVEAYLRLAFESVLPRMAKTEVLGDDYIEGVISGFDYVG